MEQMEQGASGNTKTLAKKHRRWVFTINNPNNDIDKQIKIEMEQCSMCVYQKEEGENKTPHYQGVIEYKNPISFTSMKKSFPTAHLEPCRNREASIKYCQKDIGRLAGPWKKGFRKEIETITELRPWQQEIINLIQTKPDKRTIHWYWEPTGGIGKTELAKYICLKYDALYLTGKAADCKLVISNWLQANPDKDLTVVLFDFVRSMEDYISYQALEEIKNGIFCNTKYESKMEIFNTPHVIVFSNFEPKIDALSADRWKIKKLERA